jgi:hypothetical protein
VIQRQARLLNCSIVCLIEQSDACVLEALNDAPNESERVFLRGSDKRLY